MHLHAGLTDFGRQLRNSAGRATDRPSLSAHRQAAKERGDMEAVWQTEAELLRRELLALEVFS